MGFAIELKIICGLIGGDLYLYSKGDMLRFKPRGLTESFFVCLQQCLFYQRLAGNAG